MGAFKLETQKLDDSCA